MDELTQERVDDEPIEPEPAADGEAPPTTVENPPGSRRWWIPVSIIGGVLILGLLASQAYLIVSLEDTRAALTQTSDDVHDLESEVDDIAGAVGSLGQAMTEIAAAQSAAASTPVSGVLPGALPQFTDGQADQAVGMVLGDVVGVDAYSGETTIVTPSDGTKRVWMVWAHWCPYCQEELPTLSASYAALRTAYPDIDITTVSTSIDPSRGNPLDEYLATEQFPFTVLIDEDYSLASQLGVSAFPFWVVTDGEGRVLFRTAGFLSETQIDGLVENLDRYEPQA